MNPPACQRKIARGGWAEDAYRNSCSGMIGPRNTLSNLAYPVVGIVMVLLMDSSASRVFALSMLLLGLGSAWYHWTKTLKANRADWFGMLSVFWALSLHGLNPAGTDIWISMLVGCTAMAAVCVYALKQVGANRLIAWLLVISGLPATFTGDWRLVVVSLAAFALSFALWHADKRKLWVVGLWGHALWHVGTALAFGLMYLAQLSMNP